MIFGISPVNITVEIDADIVDSHLSLEYSLSPDMLDVSVTNDDDDDDSLLLHDSSVDGEGATDVVLLNQGQDHSLVFFGISPVNKTVEADADIVSVDVLQMNILQMNILFLLTCLM